MEVATGEGLDPESRPSFIEQRGCLGVIHVPKSGGTALRQALSLIPGSYTGPVYFDQPYFGIKAYAEGMPHDHPEAPASQDVLVETVGSHRIVIGHYSGRSLIDAGCVDLALLVREPRGRLLSLYRYWQNVPESEWANRGAWGREVVSKTSLSLGSFLTLPGIWPAVDNLITRQSLGYRGQSHRRLRRKASMNEAYREVLPFLSVVEWTVHSTRFLERICEHVGHPDVPHLGRENTTSSSGEEQVLDRSTLRTIERMTESDRDFLARLCDDDVLTRRSSHDLKEEFEMTATRLGFRLG